MCPYLRGERPDWKVSAVTLRISTRALAVGNPAPGRGICIQDVSRLDRVRVSRDRGHGVGGTDLA